MGISLKLFRLPLIPLSVFGDFPHTNYSDNVGLISTYFIFGAILNDIFKSLISNYPSLLYRYMGGTYIFIQQSC